MKYSLMPWAGFGLLLMIFLFGACETDGIIDPGETPLGPEIRLLSDVGFVSTDAQVVPGATFRVKVNAVAGDADLKSLRITEDGTNIPSSRLTIEAGGTDVTNNPLLITSAFVSGTTWEISIDAPVDAAVRNYQFTVADEENLTASVNIDVEVFGQLSVSLARPEEQVTVAGQSDYAVGVIGTRGAAALDSLAVYADGVLLPAENLLFGGTAVGGNPILLVAAEKTSFDTELVIKTGERGTTTYKIELKDESGAVDTTTFDLTVLVEYTALLINNKDGQQLGGLDLDEGQTVAFDSQLAEIRDKGITLSLPNAQNWYQQILPVNGAELRMPDLTQAENFSYENANTRAVIVAAFESGITKTESDPVAVDDLFLIKRVDNYYLLQCTKVEVTANDNKDFYEFNVKQVRGKE